MSRMKKSALRSAYNRLLLCSQAPPDTSPTMLVSLCLRFRSKRLLAPPDTPLAMLARFSRLFACQSCSLCLLARRSHLLALRDTLLFTFHVYSLRPLLRFAPSFAGYNCLLRLLLHVPRFTLLMNGQLFKWTISGMHCGINKWSDKMNNWSNEQSTEWTAELTNVLMNEQLVEWTIKGMNDLSNATR